MKRPRRIREPFMPITPLRKGERPLIAIERLVKGALFQCSMCGNCLLQETAFICPLLCPKGLRNGPCGSGCEDHCCVDPDRPCVWHLIYQRAERLGRMDSLLEVQAPLDWSQVGHETWATVVREAIKRGLMFPVGRDRQDGWGTAVSEMFREIRQPDWWQGDDQYHPPCSLEPVSPLQAALERGEFVVTAEITPPSGAGPAPMLEFAARLKGLVHAANITENPMAKVRLSTLATCALVRELGIETVMQITARDYNRLALQSEVLGAAALGMHNVLCLTGDPPTDGGHPTLGLPFDLDATQMLWILRRLRDEGHFLDGRQVKGRPQLFLGAAGSPGTKPCSHEAFRMERKVNAGAQFIQTQIVYDFDLLRRWLDGLNSRGILDKVHILVGIAPLHSPKTARFLNDSIPDVTVPKPILDRIEASPEPEVEGAEIALEFIDRVRELPAVSGAHVMSLGSSSSLPDFLTRIRRSLSS